MFQYYSIYPYHSVKPSMILNQYLFPANNKLETIYSRCLYGFNHDVDYVIDNIRIGLIKRF